MAIITEWWWLALLVGLPAGIAISLINHRTMRNCKSPVFPETELKEIIATCRSEGKSPKQALSLARVYLINHGHMGSSCGFHLERLVSEEYYGKLPLSTG